MKIKDRKLDGVYRQSNRRIIQFSELNNKFARNVRKAAVEVIGKVEKRLQENSQNIC